MKKHYINGKEKATLDTTPSCRTCKDGELFRDRPYRLDDIYPIIKEGICLICETKYKVERITTALPVEILSTKDIYESEIQGLKIEDELITERNYPYFILKISEDYGEAIKMNPKVIELRGKIVKDICPGHIWIDSKPFKTFEGSFSIKNCAVCKRASVLYKKVIKYGTLSELINFLVEQSIIYNEEVMKKGELFSDMILKDLDFNLDPKDITNSILEAKELKTTKNDKPLLTF